MALGFCKRDQGSILPRFLCVRTCACVCVCVCVKFIYQTTFLSMKGNSYCLKISFLFSSQFVDLILLDDMAHCKPMKMCEELYIMHGQFSQETEKD